MADMYLKGPLAKSSEIGEGLYRKGKAGVSGFTGLGDRPSVMDEDSTKLYDSADLIGLLSGLLPSKIPASVVGALSAVAPMIAKNAKRNVLKDAQAFNTFKMSDRAGEYGRNTGYPQPAGTPVEKLFSNFADNSTSTPEQVAAFREGMLNRASPKYLSDEMYYPGKVTSETIVPFNGGNALLRVNNQRGDVRFAYPAGAEIPEVAAALEKGYIDSIASKTPGSGLGEALLRYLDDNGLANIREVADRSPGFVKIQKKVLSDK